MTTTDTPKELLNRIGKERYSDVSRATTKEDGSYVATATRRLKHTDRRSETVIEPDEQFRSRDLASYDDHPDGYDGHELPTITDWAQEHGKAALDGDDGTVSHELQTIGSRNEAFGECDRCGGEGTHDCPECDGTGRIDCSVCDGTGRETVFETCEACAGRGDIERMRERRCRVCNGSGEVSRNGANVRCPNCDGSTSELRPVSVSCKVCDGSGERSVGEEPCRNCDQGNQVSCPNCHTADHVVCDDCAGDGAVWEYERVTDRYRVELDVSIDPSPSELARNLIEAGKIEWEHVDEETREGGSLAEGSGVIREQRATFRTPMQVVSYLPVEETSVYTGETYKPWQGGAQIERVGDHVEEISADFGEISRPGPRPLLKQVLYSLPIGLVLAIVLAFSLTQLDSAYGLARNAAGGIVTLSVLGASVVSRIGLALGLVLIGLVASAPTLGVASGETVVNGILFGTIPIVIGVSPIAYRYVTRR